MSWEPFPWLASWYSARHAKERGGIVSALALNYRKAVYCTGLKIGDFKSIPASPKTKMSMPEDYSFLFNTVHATRCFYTTTSQYHCRFPYRWIWPLWCKTKQNVWSKLKSNFTMVHAYFSEQQRTAIWFWSSESFLCTVLTQDVFWNRGLSLSCGENTQKIICASRFDLQLDVFRCLCKSPCRRSFYSFILFIRWSMNVSQIRGLKEVDSLKDMTIRFGSVILLWYSDCIYINS